MTLSTSSSSLQLGPDFGNNFGQRHTYFFFWVFVFAVARPKRKTNNNN